MLIFVEAVTSFIDTKFMRVQKKKLPSILPEKLEGIAEILIPATYQAYPRDSIFIGFMGSMEFASSSIIPAA
eukprot:SAG11_NODE_2315_length_3533_cov_1.847991_1_plen_72_part_00